MGDTCKHSALDIFMPTSDCRRHIHVACRTKEGPRVCGCKALHLPASWSAELSNVTCESARNPGIWLGCPCLCVWVTPLCVLCEARSAVSVSRVPVCCLRSRRLRAHSNGTAPRRSQPSNVRTAPLTTQAVERRSSLSHYSQ